MTRSPIPPLLRDSTATCLLEHHRAWHGVARLASPSDDGIAVSCQGRRVASLQASGPEDAVAFLALALNSLLEVAARERRSRAELARRVRTLQPVQVVESDGSLTETRDTLTGLLSRLSLEDAALGVLEEGRRSLDPVSLVICDVDRTRELNRELGRAAGDAVLAAVARVLRSGRRRGDLVGRWTGDSFVLVLRNCGESAARAVAEGLRETVSRVSINIDNQSVGVAACFGVSTAVPTPEEETVITWTTLLAAADARLFRGKELGGDRVVGAENVATSALPPQERRAASSVRRPC